MASDETADRERWRETLSDLDKSKLSVYGLEADLADPSAAAARRYAWVRSSEARTLRRLSYWAITAAVAAGVIGAAIGYAVTPPFGVATSYAFFAGLGSVSVVAYVAGTGMWVARRRLQRRFSDKVLLGIAAQELAAAEEEISTGSTDFGTLWTATQKRLDYYHKIATTQSERSFLNGQIAACAGFSIVIGAAIAAAFSRSAAAAIASAVTGIAGGGLGAYVGATFMKSQDAATAQLRAYFDQPLEFSRILAAERLIFALDEKGRTDAYHKLIDALSSSHAAMHSSTEGAR